MDLQKLREQLSDLGVHVYEQATRNDRFVFGADSNSVVVTEGSGRFWMTLHRGAEEDCPLMPIPVDGDAAKNIMSNEKIWN